MWRYKLRWLRQGDCLNERSGRPGPVYWVSVQPGKEKGEKGMVVKEEIERVGERKERKGEGRWGRGRGKRKRGGGREKMKTAQQFSYLQFRHLDAWPHHR